MNATIGKVKSTAGADASGKRREARSAEPRPPRTRG